MKPNSSPTTQHPEVVVRRSRLEESLELREPFVSQRLYALLIRENVHKCLALENWKSCFTGSICTFGRRIGTPSPARGQRGADNDLHRSLLVAADGLDTVLVRLLSAHTAMEFHAHTKNARLLFSLSCIKDCATRSTIVNDQEARANTLSCYTSSACKVA